MSRSIYCAVGFSSVWTCVERLNIKASPGASKVSAVQSSRNKPSRLTFGLSFFFVPVRRRQPALRLILVCHIPGVRGLKGHCVVPHSLKQSQMSLEKGNKEKLMSFFFSYSSGQMLNLAFFSFGFVHIVSPNPPQTRQDLRRVRFPDETEVSNS